MVITLLNASVPQSHLSPEDGMGEATVNMFCPTGEGGGVDPTCSPNVAERAESFIDTARYNSGIGKKSGEDLSEKKSYRFAKSLAAGVMSARRMGQHDVADHLLGKVTELAGHRAQLFGEGKASFDIVKHDHPTFNPFDKGKQVAVTSPGVHFKHDKFGAHEDGEVLLRAKVGSVA